MYCLKIEKNVKEGKKKFKSRIFEICFVTSLLSPCDFLGSPFVVVKQHKCNGDAQNYKKSLLQYDYPSALSVQAKLRRRMPRYIQYGAKSIHTGLINCGKWVPKLCTGPYEYFWRRTVTSCPCILVDFSETNKAKQRDTTRNNNVGNSPKPCPTEPVNLPRALASRKEIRAAGHSLDMTNHTGGWLPDHYSFV
jgi:hypothetical protein